MRRALTEARTGRGLTAPNPVVGACIVALGGELVGRGVTAPAGGPHAEVQALAEAGDRARGATLYCTLEPCAHTGRTGPCAGRIVAAGVARVVAAIRDPFPGVNGQGFAFLRDRGVIVDVGEGFAEAELINRPYLQAVRAGRPFVILKAATSLDGRIAEREGVRTALTSELANQHVHQHRAQADAIAVGSGTVLVDDPLLTPRGVKQERPLARIIFDRRLRTPPAARLFSTLDSGPVTILTTVASLRRRPSSVAALEQAGATVRGCAGDVIADGLPELSQMGIHSVIVEGGARVHAAVWDAGLTDFVRLYVVPRWLGRLGVPLLEGRSLSLSALECVRSEQLGPDVLIEGYVHRSH